MGNFLDKSGLARVYGKIKAGFLPLSGGTLTGTLKCHSYAIFNSGGGSYNEGIRCNLGSAGDDSAWSSIALGGAYDSTSGTAEGVWTFCTNAKNFYLGHNGSSGATYGWAWLYTGELNLKTSSLKNNNNTIWHAGNDGSGSGLDADLLDGQHGSYYAAASSLSSYLPISGGTLTGPLIVNNQSNQYGDFNEGIRLCRAKNSWVGITFGSSGSSGAPTGGWFVATNPSDQFIIDPDSSSSTTGLTLNSGGDAKWRNYKIWTAGDTIPFATDSTNSTNSRYVIGDNNAKSPGYALLQSGSGRKDESPGGDTWIYYDTLGGTSQPWGIRHDQGPNTISFIGGGSAVITLNMETGAITGSSIVKSNGSSSQFLKADGSVDSTSYVASSSLGSMAYASTSSFLSSSGGTLSGASNVLNISSSNANCWIYYYASNTAKASTGYYSGMAFVANETTYARIGVLDDGTPSFRPSSSGTTYTLYHTGNLSPLTTSNYATTLGTVYHPYGGSSSVSLSCSGMTAYGNIAVSNSQSSSATRYITAGPGYSTGSGKYGLKVLCCDQSDCQSGMGQDLGIYSGWSNAYNFSVVGGNSSTDYGYISFVTHKVNSTSYRWVGGFYDNAGSVTFRVAGNIYASGTLSCGSASDLRLKKDITNLDINKAYSIIENLTPKSYSFNDICYEKSEKEIDPNLTHLGYIAQEVLPYLPGAVNKNLWGDFYRLDYNELIPVLHAVIKDLIERIKRLESKEV